MNKNLWPKIILIIVLVVFAALSLYPPSKTLKPGIDLAGGTSLIYEIDTQGLPEEEKRDLSQRMITVLRRRIDPANIQNLIWRPQGNTRFEIQMPLASVETRAKRLNYEKAMTDLLAENINPAVIMRSLQKPAEQRTADFEKFAQGSPVRLEILKELAAASDERIAIQNDRDTLAAKLREMEGSFPSAKLDLSQIKANLSKWAKLDEQQLADSLKEFLGSDSKLDLLTNYVGTYAKWANVVSQLTDTETGINVRYGEAKKAVDKLSLTEDQINVCLEMSPKSAKRVQAVEELKAQFPARSEMIDKAVVAFDEYRPFKGRLDDSGDLQRMLKGAGVLEFRILPISGHPQVDSDRMARYFELLKTKGPKYASDAEYLWCEVENIKEWRLEGSVVGQFGDKFYVLASNKQDETMLHTAAQKEWKLIKARPGSEPQTGQRAIDFVLDDRGGRLFSNVTGKNIDRPLCILLDGIAISAPSIRSKIFDRGQITGSFTQTEVEDMVSKLNAGSLPARLVEQPIWVKTIGPSIGADNRDKGIKAGLIGLAGVIVCMLAYYMLAGAIADMALLMNLLFVLAIMALSNATFTLPGIAGLILTIGMSVDANVLIFERVREEQAKGTSLRLAIKNGYEKAFSAIFDSNITTIITAAILYWRGSEEIKGFAITLMLGISSSMFTALTVTHTIFDFLMNKRIIKDHLFMLHLIRKPNINWMSFRPIFFTLSAVLTIGGIIVFLTRDNTKNNKYDIEFTGGTSVQINLKDSISLTRQDVENRIRREGADLGNPALETANVYSIGKSGKQYEITTTETNKTAVTVTFPQTIRKTTNEILLAIEKAQDKFDRELSRLLVKQGSNPAAFIITTSQTNKTLVKEVLSTAFPDANISEPQVEEVVNNAVLTAFGDELEIQRNLQPKVTFQEKITGDLIDIYPELADFLGGVKIACEIEKPATRTEIEGRFTDLLFKPDMRGISRYPYKILAPNLDTVEPQQSLSSFVYVTAEPEAGLREFTEDEWKQFAENETAKVLAATSLETSLPRVTQIDPSVGEEAKTQALIAIVLSLIAMLIYIWVRFGDLRFGFGAVATLFHDTCVTVGTVTACTYIAATTIGQNLLIGDFKIDLAMIAAFLTLLGYSINDTIVIYDRIRENRRKGTALTPQIINNSINETLSRTLLTGITTLLVVFVMYVFGGAGLRGFNFAILFGIIEGTYSSIAISAPILLFRLKPKEGKKQARVNRTN